MKIYNISILNYHGKFNYVYVNDKRSLEYDLFYIENWTVGFDIKILFLTVFKGFINKNAY